MCGSYTRRKACTGKLGAKAPSAIHCHLLCYSFALRSLNYCYDSAGGWVKDSLRTGYSLYPPPTERPVIDQRLRDSQGLGPSPSSRLRSRAAAITAARAAVSRWSLVAIRRRRVRIVS